MKLTNNCVRIPKVYEVKNDLNMVFDKHYHEKKEFLNRHNSEITIFSIVSNLKLNDTDQFANVT